jgi:asparagine synthase (glutamine-hydrolysing)
MPGIVGFQGAADPQAGATLLAAMVEAMGIEDNYEVDSYVATGVGLARIHLNIVDRVPQPLWSADGNVALVMTGEIFGWDGLSLDKHLTGKEPDFSNAELLLAAYTRFGEAFPEHVNGTFAAAIWNKAEETLLLVTDLLSSYPLYYAQVGDLLTFGSGARAAAQAPGLRRSQNLTAVAELMAFEHLYGDKTLFAGVYLLLPATILRFQRGTLSLSTYIDYQHPEYYEMHKEEYYIDMWIQHMRQAVARQARGPAPLGVLLTGGLDSRSILGMLAGNDIEVRTMTFGIPDCDDEMAARQLAHMLRLPHKFFPLPPDFLVHLGAKAVRNTDGQKSVVHSNMIGALNNLVQESRILYKGFLGGTIHGYIVSHDRLAPMPEAVWFEHVFAERTRVFSEQEWPQLYTDAAYRHVGDVPRQSLRQALARSCSTWWADKDSYVDLYEEDVRFTVMGVELARTQALVRTPLADKDMLRFTTSVPPGYRVDKNYYRRAIIKAFPELSKVVYSGSRRPLNQACFRDLRMRLDEQTRWWLRDHGLTWVPVTHGRPYADYTSWLRNELRSWLEEILLSPQALDRGVLQPSYVRNLVAEHMAGCDHTRKISMLLTLELWNRQFLD